MAQSFSDCIMSKLKLTEFVPHTGQLRILRQAGQKT